VPVRFIELTGEFNTAMPRVVVARVGDALDQHSGKGLTGARVLIVGLAYKKDVDNPRESPALRIMELLHERGAAADYHDRFIPVIGPSRAHQGLAGASIGSRSIMQR